MRSLAAIVLLFALSRDLSASTLYVNAATGSDTAGNGSAASPWRTITRALSAPPKPGDVISAAAGTYGVPVGESFPLRLPPAVALRGADAATTIVWGIPSKPVIEMSHDGSYLFESVVEMLTVKGGQDGVRIFSQLNRRVEPTVRDCRIE